MQMLIHPEEFKPGGKFISFLVCLFQGKIIPGASLLNGEAFPLVWPCSPLYLPPPQCHCRGISCAFFFWAFTGRKWDGFAWPAWADDWCRYPSSCCSACLHTMLIFFPRLFICRSMELHSSGSSSSYVHMIVLPNTHVAVCFTELLIPFQLR